MNHKSDQQEQPCQHCGKMFQNERKLRKHICYYHTVVKCDVCNESFDQRKKLYDHKQRQVGIKMHNLSMFFFNMI